MKVEVPPEHWDGMFAPTSCVTLDTTVDTFGRVNAAPHATACRVSHHPVHIALTVNDFSHTAANIEATREFVVNVVPFDDFVLSCARVAGLPFDAGVDELERAGLTTAPSRAVAAPLVKECRLHFECVVEWSKHWNHRTMVVGAVVAVSVDADCYDREHGRAFLDRVRPAQYCGTAHDSAFVPAYRSIHVPIPYDGPRDWRPDLAETSARSGVPWSGSGQLT